MKREKNPNAGNKSIMEDEAGYEDHNTVELINLIVEIIINATLAQAEATQNQAQNR